jgi:hypothetical protein
MHLPFGPWLAVSLIAATAFASLYDLAMVAARLMEPWLGWMFP